MKSMLDFSYRLFNLEARSCGEHLTSSVPHVTAEIVEWILQDSGEGMCITIAYWVEHSEGYDLKFCGDRPFANTVDRKDFWILASECQATLDDYFEEMNE